MRISSEAPPLLSRYATREEALSRDFMVLNQEFDRISGKYDLPDHASLNRARYPWARCLHYPEFYASRLWEYPWAILESGVTSGMRCADVGCGQSPFTIYLKEIVGCEVVGFDPDYGTQTPSYCHGVPEEFSRRTGLHVVEAGVQKLECPDESFDRVFCISVIEHIPNWQDRAAGMREIARVLRPGGLALISVDVNLKSRIVNPLELIWESGLELYGSIDLTMPTQRFGIFCDGRQPADVFGLALHKCERQIETEYGHDGPLTEAWRVGYIRDTFPPEWSDELRPAPAFQQILSDWKRNVAKDGRPSITTLARIFFKGILRRYLPIGSAGDRKT